MKTETKTKTESVKRPVKVNGYKSAVKTAKWEKKLKEGEIRQMKHDKLSVDQKIKLAKSRRGESKREIARLQKKLDWDKAMKVSAKVADPTPEKKGKVAKK